MPHDAAMPEPHAKGRIPRIRGERARAEILQLFLGGTRPPTQQEIADAVGLGRRTVRFHLDVLVREGKLVYVDGHRGYELPSELDAPGDAPSAGEGAVE